MPNINTNEFIRATAAPSISVGWITPDLKELGYVATLMIPVIKLGLLTEFRLDDKRIERNNVFHLQVHLTQEQLNGLLKSLEPVKTKEADENISARMGQIKIGSEKMSYTDLEPLLAEQLSGDQLQVLILGLVEQATQKDPEISKKLRATLEAYY